jgi:hypothetical protein
VSECASRQRRLNTQISAELQKARLNSFCRYAAEERTWAAQTLEANLFSKE